MNGSHTSLRVLCFIFADKTIKLWKVSERDRRAEGYNLKEDSGLLRDPSTINTLRVRKKRVKKGQQHEGMHAAPSSVLLHFIKI